MLYESRVKLMGTTPKFPDYTGERVYMEPIWKTRDGLVMPTSMHRWNEILEVMTVGVPVNKDQPLYVMIDQQFVKANSYHRRGGMHIDGYWNAHGPGSWEFDDIHKATRRGPLHGPKKDGWQPFPPSHKPSSRHTSAIVGWGDSAFEEPEGIILATNVEATMAYEGQFYGPIGDGGDCSDIRTTNPLKETWLEAGNVYAGNVTMLHQTHPVPVDCYRTVVRINAPGWTV